MKYKAVRTSTLFDTLHEAFPESSKNTIRLWIRSGRVSVDSIMVTTNDHKIATNQCIEVEERRVKRDGPLKLAYEDDELVVVDKPVGLLSVASASEKLQTVHALLKARYRSSQVFVVHRLDRETSGLMVFARTYNAFSFLKEELFHRRAKREYYAVVHGTLEGKGTWSSYLYEDTAFYVHVTTDPNRGEQAITHFQSLATQGNTTLVRFDLETGKKNQIRVQAAAAGHPLLGDTKYGPSHSRYKRLCLHARRLSFPHPITKKPLTFTSPLPRELSI